MATSLKIKDFEIFVVETLPPYRGGRYWTFLKLITDEEVEGIGELTSLAAVGREASNVKLLEDLCRRYVLGHDPFKIEALMHRLYTYDHDFRHPDLTVMSAISAIEIACWDIIGKYLGHPIYNLLGGTYNEKLKAYSYIPEGEGWRKLTPDEVAEKSLNVIKKGFRALKLDPFPPIYPSPRDISIEEINYARKILKSIRDTVGDDVEICVGTHGQLTTYSAIRVAKMLEEFNPLWFEEPVPPENVDEMAIVAAHTTVPIAAGERRVTKYEFLELLQKRAARIIQMDVGRCGGILESKKIASMAEAYYASIAPHMYFGPIVLAATIQLDVCSPNFLMQELNVMEMHDTILKVPIKLENGYIIPPKGPGLGVELRDDIVSKHIRSRV
ncbi:MAG: mandelate racemase/muconate lactonizing enzyme family protein [Sulfolobales archaeon]|nr:mandelate racemase/muconate lactonizing enzyme family protein [Sulfolobales archaeon]